MLKNDEINGMEEIGLVTPTPGLLMQIWAMSFIFLHGQFDEIPIVKSLDFYIFRSIFNKTAMYTG